MLVLLTGNNLDLRKDMKSRVLKGRLIPDCRIPKSADLSRSPTCASMCLMIRIKIVNAVLTILHAHHIAGRPTEKLEEFGRFEEWSAKIRQPMVWAGFDDPCLTRETIIVDDPDRDATLAVLSHWYRVHPQETTLRELTAQTVSYFNGSGYEVEGDESLKVALLEVAPNKKNPGQIDQRTLGTWCRDNEGNVIGGFKLLKHGFDRQNFRIWQVCQVIQELPKQEPEKPAEPEKPKEPQGPEAF